MTKPVVVFVCVQNAGRSQMAEALFNRAARGRGIGRSAGTAPAAALHPEVVASMAEMGLDVSDAKPKGLTADVLDGVDVVVTMGCGESCPVVPGARVVDWALPDPAGKSADDVRAIRDRIAALVEGLLAEL